MALYTSTPKCKLLSQEKVTLLSMESGDEDSSSGYDSPAYLSNNKKERCQRKLQVDSSSDDSDFSSGESAPYSDTFSDSDSDDDDSDDADDIESIESMKVTSTQSLIDNIRYILSMPDLCDVMFIVGPGRVPVYGLKAILSTRSRSFFTMFLKYSKEDLKDKKKSKKTKNSNSAEQIKRLTIIIDNYDADVFRTFLLFVHCGSVTIDTNMVTGLLCLATEFDLPDLRHACWEFIDRCIEVPANSSTLMQDTFKYGEHKAAQKLRLKILRIPVKRLSLQMNRKSETDLSKSEQEIETSTDTVV